MQAVNNMVELVLLDGKRFDCGSVEGYINAIKYASYDYIFD
jgi:UTP-glucose-1-phosphate uridylyltransferase